MWRIILYGIVAASLLAGLAYSTKAPDLYFAAAFAFIFVCGLGYMMNRAVNFAQIKDEDERKNAAAKNESIALRIFQILAVPTFIVGCVMGNDLFIATPIHDTAIVTDKSIGTGRSHDHYLQLKGLQIYSKAVPRWFYNSCTLHDTADLSLTPLFKDWHEVSLIRNGVVEAKTTPADTYWMAAIAIGCLFPILLLVRQARDFLGENSFVPFRGKIIGVYFLIVVVCEIIAVGVSIKFLTVLLGFSQSM